jgi:hypothetical protein
MQLTQLKINVKSLSAESRIIKAQEAKIIRLERRRAKAKARLGLKHESDGTLNAVHNHRTVELRREARVKQLAYAFMRWVKTIEHNEMLMARHPGQPVPLGRLITYKDVEAVTYSLPCGWVRAKTPRDRAVFYHNSFEPVIDAVRRFGYNPADLLQRFSAWTGGFSAEDVVANRDKRAEKIEARKAQPRVHRTKEQWIAHQKVEGLALDAAAAYANEDAGA